jgi:glucose/arabinose dehydrogenase
MRGIAQPAAACAAFAVLFFLVGAGPRPATSAIPAAFTDTLVASVDNPTAMAFTPDGRILVTAQFGQLRVIANDALLSVPAVDISSALCTSEEQGLLGVERDPSFAANGFVYLYYTHARGSTCENRVSRFTMSGNVINPSSELVLIDGIPSLGNHNAGDLHFGPDGYLYVSVGDAGCDYLGDSGCAGANDASRDQNVLLGKILRITSIGGIPPSNPFQGADSASCAPTGRTDPGKKCQETFARGLRNPFRFTFDPNDPGGRFFINDVGQNDWEEVDLGAAGADYGWNVREGSCVQGAPTNCGSPPAGMTNPVFSYLHDGCNAAITGGSFVPNGIWPTAFDGGYLYADYVCGKIFLLTPAGGGTFTKTEFGTGLGAVVNLAFGPAPVSQAPSGRALYYTNYNAGGQVRRIAYSIATNRSPTASVTPSAIFGPAPLTVTFDGAASSDPDSGDTLSYDWSFGDGSPTATTTTPQTTHRYTSSVNATATLTVRDNHGASASMSVQLYPGDTPPQPAISSPAAGSLFSVGQTLTLNGSATDAEEGALAPASLSWRAVRHHATHTHPFLAPTTGNGITIVAPEPEDLLAATNSYLELELTATDSRGLTGVVTRDVQPRKVDVSLATNPVGLQVSINGQAFTTPLTVTSWDGWALSLAAQTQTNGSGQTWNFSSWSDGGAASHPYLTPSSASTVTATFAQSVTPPGLVGAWGFSEGLGSVAGDSSGAGNGGAISGPVWTTAGKFGSALTFDGVNDWVSVPDAASLDVSRMTLEAWVRPTLLGAWRTVLLKERPGGIVYGLYVSQSASRPVGQVDIGGERDALGTAAVPLNAWTHLAVTYDGSMLRLFVNGVASGTAAFTGSIPASTGVLRIGGNSIWGEWFRGSLDELRLYNRALSPAEIQADMNRPI